MKLVDDKFMNMCEGVIYCVVMEVGVCLNVEKEKSIGVIVDDDEVFRFCELR